MSRAGALVGGIVLGAAAMAALVYYSPETWRGLVGERAPLASGPPSEGLPPPEMERPAVAEPAAAEPATDVPVDPAESPALVDAFSGEEVDADTLLLEPTGRVDDACPGRVGAAHLARVEFFAGEPGDDTQVFPIDVESDGAVAALFVFRDGIAPTVRCTYGDGADAAVIESPLPVVPSCLVEMHDDLRIACPSPIAAP